MLGMWTGPPGEPARTDPRFHLPSCFRGKVCKGQDYLPGPLLNSLSTSPCAPPLLPFKGRAGLGIALGMSSPRGVVSQLFCPRAGLRALSQPRNKGLSGARPQTAFASFSMREVVLVRTFQSRGLTCAGAGWAGNDVYWILHIILLWQGNLGTIKPIHFKHITRVLTN